MLRGQVGRQWKGTYDLHFNHHDSIKALKTSYATGCAICRLLFEEVVTNVKQDLGIDLENNEGQASGKVATDSIETILSARSTAMLAIIDEFEDDDIFRLDFKLELGIKGKSSNTIKRTFILKQIGTSGSQSTCQSSQG